MPSYNLPTYLPLPHPSLHLQPRPPSPPLRVASVAAGNTLSSCPITARIAPRPPASLRQTLTGQYLPPTHPQAHKWTRKSYRRSPLAFERPSKTSDHRSQHVRHRSLGPSCPNGGVVSMRYLNRVDPRPLHLPEWYTDFEPSCKEYRMYEHLARATAEKTLRNQMIKGDRFSEHESGASLGERELRLWAICLSVKRSTRAMRTSASPAEQSPTERKAPRSSTGAMTPNLRPRISFPSTRARQQSVPQAVDETSSEPLAQGEPRPPTSSKLPFHRRSGLFPPSLPSLVLGQAPIISSPNRTPSSATAVSTSSTTSALSNLGKRIKAFASVRRSSSDAIRSLTSSGHEMIKSLEALLNGTAKDDVSDEEMGDESTYSSQGRSSSSSSLSSFLSESSRSRSTSIESEQSDSSIKWRRMSLYSLPNHTTNDLVSSPPKASFDDQLPPVIADGASSEKKVRRGSWGGRTRALAAIFES
ncbi:BQ2448_3560 [Microbotryum intermedium]|uniref:BQ2448_3560 protein n=1 Tax=Microbotryum intermedium TaxID=269621 RepID=A0A238FHZ9_9BASI|nr:BQ2448_3560 [Microbotryum intermedium]